MSGRHAVDEALVHWGERLFYPRVRFKELQTPLLSLPRGDRAAYFRARIEAAVLRRPSQVMVKVTGGGRGMRAIAAHFFYISKHGSLDIEDEHGRTSSGRETLKEILADWKVAGTAIDEVGFRREAINVMLSMPRGTDPNVVRSAARAFAKAELADHRYVLVLHDHQANPHVHLSVRAESRQGVRLSPRKADLHRWREVFAEKLRDLGIDAEATQQATRGQSHSRVTLGRLKAVGNGRRQSGYLAPKGGAVVSANLREAAHAWNEIASALSTSTEVEDQRLAMNIRRFVTGSRLAERGQVRQSMEERHGPDFDR